MCNIRIDNLEPTLYAIFAIVKLRAKLGLRRQKICATACSKVRMLQSTHAPKYALLHIHTAKLSTIQLHCVQISPRNLGNSFTCIYFVITTSSLTLKTLCFKILFQ